MLKTDNNELMVKEKVAHFTKKMSEEIAINLINKSIKFDSNDFNLTKFIRENFILFESFDSKRIEFIQKFLSILGLIYAKQTINTIYIRVKKENKKV